MSSNTPTVDQTAQTGSFSSEVACCLRYLYYLRFSILLWAFPLVLWWANWPANDRSLVSGVITPETWGEYLCVFFFLIADSLVALMLARIVVINGESRFGDCPPKLLARLLAHPNTGEEWFTLLVSQANTVVLTIYFFANGADEGVDPSQVAVGLVAALVTSFLFWYAVTAIYYLTYRPDNDSEKQAAAKENRTIARTLILPRSLIFLSPDGKKHGFGDVLEDADTPLPTGWLARLFPVTGYRWPPKGSLFEGHYFSLLSATGFFALYWFLWPLTAPIAAHAVSTVALALEVIGGIAVYVLVLSAKAPGIGTEEEQQNKKTLRLWKAILALPILGFSIGVPILCTELDVSRFPILALVLILVISLAWLFGAVAFYADRYRIPVLTVFLVAIIIPRLFHWTGAREEHYLSIALKDAPTTLPTPAEILDARIRREQELTSQQKQPASSIPTFFVVTSTGGGIHAAGWTTAVLQHLESQFGDHFHDHVLLLSTVSGGSAGLLTYLRELHDAGNGESPQWSRMVPEAECSSLEAIGWGLVYYDVPKAIVPFLPTLVSPSTGVDDLRSGPLGMDRTWSLRRAFERNLNDPHCRPAANPGLKVPKSEVDAAQSQADASYGQLTLGEFNAMQSPYPYPAFSMNTTTVENGSRFLLSNYKVTRDADIGVPAPAESFLDVYGSTGLVSSRYADLPLQTAAQMSATFPYVSSAATFPAVPGKQTVHFVDGGYYDNDGTATALEFLRSALIGSSELNSATAGSAALAAGKQPSSTTTPRKVRILLVEIRNSKEANAGPFPLALKDDPDKKCKAWNLGDQLTAPLKAFYGGGHGSVTGRNRSILALLEAAYSDKLVLRHFLITDETNGSDNVSCLPDKSPATDPLNWSLTPRQRGEVGASAEMYDARYDHIRRCFLDDAVCPKGEEEVPH